MLSQIPSVPPQPITITASQIFWDLLDRTTGIRPGAHPPSSDEDTNDTGPDDDHLIISPVQPWPKTAGNLGGSLANGMGGLARSVSATRLRVKLPPLPMRRGEVEYHSDAVVDVWEREPTAWSSDLTSLKHLAATVTDPILAPPQSSRRRNKRSTQKPRTSLTKDQIQSHFRTLFLHDCEISQLDEEFRSGFRNLDALSLTGNRIEWGGDEAVGEGGAGDGEGHVERAKGAKVGNVLRGVPPSITILTLNANLIKSPPPISHLRHLVHLGLSHNTIHHLHVPNPKRAGSRNDLASQSDERQTIPWSAPPTLISLDLSWNRISDLRSALDVLKRWNKLRSLVMMGNPVYLLPSYKPLTLSSLPTLISLDDNPVAKQKPSQQAASAPPISRLDLAVHQLIDPPLPPNAAGSSLDKSAAIASFRSSGPSMSTIPIPTFVIDPANPPPPDEYTYAVRITLSESQKLWTGKTNEVNAAPVVEGADGEGGGGKETTAAAKKKEAANTKEAAKEAAKKKKGGKGAEVVTTDEETAAAPVVRRVDVGYVGVMEKQADWGLANAFIDGLALTLTLSRHTFIPANPPDAPPPASAASSRPTSSHKRGAAAPAKGAKKLGKGKTSNANLLKEQMEQWKRLPADSIDIGSVTIPMKPFLEGTTAVDAEYTFQPFQAEQPSKDAATRPPAPPSTADGKTKRTTDDADSGSAKPLSVGSVIVSIRLNAAAVESPPVLVPGNMGALGGNGGMGYSDDGVQV
ncbi:uncharacterized protein EV422DRAFT_195143 [Fimicolochytrium jonesii]|uniref:uncharacterized protein n=1 Tax=Fimicolochytrium jonesii TaxID=1396493 RepID=UPI0022FDC888|nr:uncharacterized protein EV422DRAFT_195143 [Fimicolochytrium jonesii]KAI8818234.1 hypothetical protein EV422DRAFT_195143 [Fimicolochytrium jonesii]